MQVTKAIVDDLLPVYLDGEASADTRAAVEEFLAKDAELRRLVETARKQSLPLLSAPASLEIRALERTRRLLGRKNFWLAFALIFTFASLMLKPLWLADCGVAIGLAGWVPFLMACKRLMATGLQTPRRRTIRLLWALVGWLVGSAVGYLIQQQIGRRSFLLPCVTFGIALWIGEKLHQIPTPEELNRPTTLFGK